MVKPKPKIFQLTISLPGPGRKKRQLLFDIDELTVEHDFQNVPYPQPCGSTIPTGYGIITARFVPMKKRRKK